MSIRTYNHEINDTKQHNQKSHRDIQATDHATVEKAQRRLICGERCYELDQFWASCNKPVPCHRAARLV